MLFWDAVAECRRVQTLQEREDAVNERCHDYDPNPSLDPERSVLMLGAGPHVTS